MTWRRATPKQPEVIAMVTQGSLHRLGYKAIDLYIFLHPEGWVTPVTFDYSLKRKESFLQNHPLPPHRLSTLNYVIPFGLFERMKHRGKESTKHKLINTVCL